MYKDPIPVAFITIENVIKTGRALGVVLSPSVSKLGRHSIHYIVDVDQGNPAIVNAVDVLPDNV